MESTLRSLNQWEVVKGLCPSPTCVDLKAPTNEEQELDQAWALWKEHAYMEIDLHIKDQQRVVICDKQDLHLAWNRLNIVIFLHFTKILTNYQKI